MIVRRLQAALAASALALVLGGCVAAAIPLAAGGVVLRNEVRGDDEPDSDKAEDESGEADPADTTATEGEPFTPTLAAPGPYQAFLTYSSEQAALDPVAEPRRSAILATPGSLQPETMECSVRPSAVLVDLDPASGARNFAELPPDPALARGLQALRLEGVFVFWISDASAAEAGTLRKRLTETGLDPTTDDGILLMRRAEDRKQLRRKELSQTHCLIAILGDERSDFDELYDYLKDPAAASPLEALIGNGWFLVPTLLDTPTLLSTKEG